MPLMASPSPRPGETRHIPAQSNSILSKAQAQWVFTDEELTRTPSLLDGMAMEAEHTMRSKGVNFILQVGIMLKLPQVTLATASVYLHRFFMRYSMVDLPQRPGMHPYSIAATSLFLATKVEENCRKMKELVVACCRVGLKQPNLVVDEQSKEFWKWRDTILHHEDMLLEALCFDLQLEQPHRILFEFLRFFGMDENKAVRNSAWAFLNDSIFTVLCLQFGARTIAASALYAAARLNNVAFEDDELGQPWWKQLDVDLFELRRTCNRIAQLYERNSVHKQSQPYPIIPVHGEAASEATRIPRYTSITGTPSEGDINGRKRSREPADEVESDYIRPHSLERRSSMNGAFIEEYPPEPSPKRQRTLKEGVGDGRPAGPDNPYDPYQSFPSSQGTIDNTNPTPWNSAAKPPQISPNGYYQIPHSDKSQALPHQRLPFSNHHHRQHHPLPPVPPVSVPPLLSYQPSRRDSNHSNSEVADPIQQRIDEIVQKGLSHSHLDKRRRDSYRPPRERDWERERDRDRDRDRDRGQDFDRYRRSSATSGSDGCGRRLSTEEQQQQQQQQQQQPQVLGRDSHHGDGDPDPAHERQGPVKQAIPKPPKLKEARAEAVDGEGSEEGEL